VSSTRKHGHRQTQFTHYHTLLLTLGYHGSYHSFDHTQ
jgi:hypothetical protein